MVPPATILLAAGVISVSSAPLAAAQPTHDERTATSNRREATIVLHVVNFAALSRDVMDPARGSRRKGLREHRRPHRVGRQRASR